MKLKFPLQTWSLIILCYNEKGTINKIIKKAIDFLEHYSSKYELIIVDDGSSDGSAESILTAIKKQKNTIFIKNPQNLGIGGSLRKAYLRAKYENVCFIPGDGQFDLKLLSQHYYVPENSILSFYRQENQYYSNWRNSLSYINKFLNRSFLGLNMHDVNWVKIYKRKDLKKIKLDLSSSLIESEICAKLSILGSQIIQVQSKYLPRVYGKSKGISIKIVFQALRDIFKLYIVVIILFKIPIRLKKLYLVK